MFVVCVMVLVFSSASQVVSHLFCAPYVCCSFCTFDFVKSFGPACRYLSNSVRSACSANKRGDWPQQYPQDATYNYRPMRTHREPMPLRLWCPPLQVQTLQVPPPPRTHRLRYPPPSHRPSADPSPPAHRPAADPSPPTPPPTRHLDPITAPTIAVGIEGPAIATARRRGAA